MNSETLVMIDNHTIATTTIKQGQYIGKGNSLLKYIIYVHKNEGWG